MTSKTKIRLNLNLNMTPLAEALVRAMVAADILGRLRVLEEGNKKGLRFLSPEQPLASRGFAELLGSFGVKPEGAINYLRSLTDFTRVAYNKLAPQYRQAAFTVARIENLKTVEALRGLLVQALDEGWSRAKFEDEANAMFDRMGVTRLNPYHLETVFQTNMQTAYQNGRLQQMADPRVRLALPYWQYRTQEDERVRPNHAALDLFVARADDPVWGSIYPPNGFNCRCTVDPLLSSEGEKILGGQINVPGRERLPAGAGPDDGFDRAPGPTLRTLASGEEP
jgi:SPP1 gp7 family putative phage head morphogenesis protein